VRETGGEAVGTVSATYTVDETDAGASAAPPHGGALVRGSFQRVRRARLTRSCVCGAGGGCGASHDDGAGGSDDVPVRCLLRGACGCTCDPRVSSEPRTHEKEQNVIACSSCVGLMMCGRTGAAVDGVVARVHATAAGLPGVRGCGSFACVGLSVCLCVPVCSLPVHAA
jgi:hypothetical protein